MTRFVLSAAAAALLLAAPVAASAATTPATPAKPATAAAAKPAKPMAHKPMVHRAAAKPAPRPRDSGSAAVDALNEQSLARAKAGQ